MASRKKRVKTFEEEMGLVPCPPEDQEPESPPPAPAEDPEPIILLEPELVDSYRKKKAPHTFTEISVYEDGAIYKRGRLSDREMKFVAMMLKTGSITKSAAEIGVTPQAASKYLQRPPVAKYLERMRDRMSKAADLTIDKIAKTLSEAIDGIEISPLQLQAASIAAKFLRPDKGPSVVINSQTNYNGTSPFAGLEQAAMLDEIKRNLLEMGVKPDAA